MVINMKFTDALILMEKGKHVIFEEYVFCIEDNEFKSKLLTQISDSGWEIDNITFEMISSNKWKEQKSITPLNKKILIGTDHIHVNDVKKFIDDVKTYCIDKSYYDGNSGFVVININDVTDTIYKHAGKKLMDWRLI